MPWTVTEEEFASAFQVDGLAHQVDDVHHLADLFFGVVLESGGQGEGLSSMCKFVFA